MVVRWLLAGFESKEPTKRHIYDILAPRYGSGPSFNEIFFGLSRSHKKEKACILTICHSFL